MTSISDYKLHLKHEFAFLVLLSLFSKEIGENVFRVFF